MIRFALLFLLSCFIISCNKDNSVNSYKDTYSDDISDITFIGNHFYTTNYDLSGNAGSQIDLMQFSSTGKNIEDVFDLSMNGQGFFAMTNDGDNLYLQSRTFNSMLICSPVGELVFHDWFVFNPSYRASGICYNDDIDSLAVLFKVAPLTNEYRLQYTAIDKPYVAGTTISNQWAVVDSTIGAYAIEYKDSAFYVLAWDTSGSDILLITDLQLSIRSQISLQDSMVVGLCFKEDDLFFSYRDRRIEYWNTY